MAMEVIGDTPDLGNAGRGAEAMQWLKANPNVTNFVAIDDGHADSFAMHFPPGHFVQTKMHDAVDSHAEGITQSKADGAIAVLMS
jgi:hypothetical protein